MKKLSVIYEDQIDKPLDRALYWIEYVLRHEGAVHLRSAARDLNFIRYFSVDVISTLVLVVVIGLVVNFLLLTALVRNLFGPKKREGAGNCKKIN